MYIKNYGEFTKFLCGFLKNMKFSTNYLNSHTSIFETNKVATINDNNNIKIE